MKDYLFLLGQNPTSGIALDATGTIKVVIFADLPEYVNAHQYRLKTDVTDKAGNVMVIYERAG